MGRHDIAVVGVGMVTSVGLSAAETAASVRAGIAQYGDSRLRDKLMEPITIAEVPDGALAPLPPPLDTLELPERDRRLLQLAATPLRECLGVLTDHGVRPPVILALPERAGDAALDHDTFLAHLAAACEGAFDVGRSDASYVGRAGGLDAIGRAADLVRGGRAEYAIAGGVDTFRDAALIRALEDEGRVKTGVNLDGFIPGEGAGFLLLTNASTAARAKLPMLAAIGPAARGFEPGHLYSEAVYRGDGLAAVLRDLVAAGAGDPPIEEVYSSMNGENFWAKEWAVGFVRHGGAFAPEHGFHHPAESYGDAGAACGPLMIGLAALGMIGGYRRAPALVYGSSDTGDRAGLVLDAAP